VACICILFCFSFLSFVSGRKAKIKWSSLGKWRSFVSFNGGFGLFFICFHRLFGARSTQPRCFSQDKRPSAEFPVVVRSCRRKHGSRRLSESGAWFARARELFVLWRACVTAMLRLFLAVRGGLWSMVADLWLGGTDDGACPHVPPSPAVSAPASFAWFFCFLFVCVVYSLVSPVQSACVLFRFY
jgi:hypothetical protein